MAKKNAKGGVRAPRFFSDKLSLKTLEELINYAKSFTQLKFEYITKNGNASKDEIELADLRMSQFRKLAVGAGENRGVIVIDFVSYNTAFGNKIGVFLGYSKNGDVVVGTIPHIPAQDKKDGRKWYGVPEKIFKTAEDIKAFLGVPKDALAAPKAAAIAKIGNYAIAAYDLLSQDPDEFFKYVKVPVPQVVEEEISVMMQA